MTEEAACRLPRGARCSAARGVSVSPGVAEPASGADVSGHLARMGGGRWVALARNPSDPTLSPRSGPFR